MDQIGTPTTPYIKPLIEYSGEPIWNRRLMALRIAEQLGFLVYLFPVDPENTDPSDLSYVVLAGEGPAPIDVRDPKQESAVRVLTATEVLPYVHALGVAHGVGHLTAYREDLR